MDGNQKPLSLFAEKPSVRRGSTRPQTPSRLDRPLIRIPTHPTPGDGYDDNMPCTTPRYSTSGRLNKPTKLVPRSSGKLTTPVLPLPNLLKSPPPPSRQLPARLNKDTHESQNLIPSKTSPGFEMAQVSWLDTGMTRRRQLAPMHPVDPPVEGSAEVGVNESSPIQSKPEHNAVAVVELAGDQLDSVASRPASFRLILPRCIDVRPGSQYLAVLEQVEQPKSLRTEHVQLSAELSDENVVYETKDDNFFDDPDETSMLISSRGSCKDEFYASRTEEVCLAAYKHKRLHAQEVLEGKSELELGLEKYEGHKQNWIEHDKANFVRCKTEEAEDTIVKEEDGLMKYELAGNEDKVKTQWPGKLRNKQDLIELEEVEMLEDFEEIKIDDESSMGSRCGQEKTTDETMAKMEPAVENLSSAWESLHFLIASRSSVCLSGQATSAEVSLHRFETTSCQRDSFSLSGLVSIAHRLHPSISVGLDTKIDVHLPDKLASSQSQSKFHSHPFDAESTNSPSNLRLLSPDKTKSTGVVAITDTGSLGENKPFPISEMDGCIGLHLRSPLETVSLSYSPPVSPNQASGDQTSLMQFERMSATREIDERIYQKLAEFDDEEIAKDINKNILSSNTSSPSPYLSSGTRDEDESSTITLSDQIANLSLSRSSLISLSDQSILQVPRCTSPCLEDLISVYQNDPNLEEMARRVVNAVAPNLMSLKTCADLELGGYKRASKTSHSPSPSISDLDLLVAPLMHSNDEADKALSMFSEECTSDNEAFVATNLRKF
ncbi:unnamed protein product, partial [Protopolystoma xenopodis]